MSRDRSNRLAAIPSSVATCARAGNWLVVLALLVWLGFAGVKRNQARCRRRTASGQPTRSLTETRAITDLGLGAVQGVAVRDGKVYAYGDVFSAKPRVGVIREYDMDLKPTGRVVWLRRDGQAP